MIDFILNLMDEYTRSGNPSDFHTVVQIPELSKIFAEDYKRRIGHAANLSNTIRKRDKYIKKIMDKPPKQKKQTGVSGAYIVKNEVATIAESIASIYEMCDKIYVLDTGSTDETLARIKLFPADRVILEERSFVPWDFSVARNYNLDRCDGDFILGVDGDEICMNTDMKMVREIPKDVISFIHLTELQNGKAMRRATQPRLFPNGSVRYAGDLHNRLELQKKKYQLLCAPEHAFSFYHFPEIGNKQAQRKNRTQYFIDKYKEKDQNFMNIYLLAKACIGIRKGDAVRYAKKALPYFKAAPLDFQRDYADYLLNSIEAHLAIRDYKIDEYLHLYNSLVGIGVDISFYNFYRSVVKKEYHMAHNYLEAHIACAREQRNQPYFTHNTLRHYHDAVLQYELYSYWKENE